MRDRHAEAWKTTLRLHTSGKNADPDTVTFANEEFYQMSRQVKNDKVFAAEETVWTLFKKPSYRKRMICAFLTMFGAESTGILVVYSTIEIS